MRWSLCGRCLWTPALSILLRKFACTKYVGVRNTSSRALHLPTLTCERDLRIPTSLAARTNLVFDLRRCLSFTLITASFRGKFGTEMTPCRGGRPEARALGWEIITEYTKGESDAAFSFSFGLIVAGHLRRVSFFFVVSIGSASFPPSYILYLSRCSRAESLKPAGLLLAQTWPPSRTLTDHCGGETPARQTTHGRGCRRHAQFSQLEDSKEAAEAMLRGGREARFWFVGGA